ncbi:hypothetical protein CSC94_18980 [Zhengella mangrovi]|uniref:Uncharacterized protein n=1 Tax=Zhengella mangrovi TaxID=1982044 RepID=A0A2G1QIV0_9HYPH|nr:hypothetical protein [Zhengella mangrovi]PHP65445.1 hypothetical protein CSC94_18980 [Zhengella mangrovi]
MQIAGSVMMGLGGVLGLIGLLTIWVPIFGIIFLMIGFGLFVAGQFLKRKGRHHAVLRKQGGRGLF